MHEAATIVQLETNDELMAFFQALVRAKDDLLDTARAQIQAKDDLLDTARAQIQAKDELLEGGQTQIQNMSQYIASLSSQLQAKAEEADHYGRMHLAAEDKVSVGMDERLAEMQRAKDKLDNMEAYLNLALDAF